MSPKPRELHGFVSYDNAAIQTSDGTRLSATVHPIYGKGNRARAIVGYEYTVEHGGVAFHGKVKGKDPARDPITLSTRQAERQATRAGTPRLRLHGVTADQVAFSVGKLYVQAFRDGDISVKNGLTEVPPTAEIRALALKFLTENPRS